MYTYINGAKGTLHSFTHLICFGLLIYLKLKHEYALSIQVKTWISRELDLI